MAEPGHVPMKDNKMTPSGGNNAGHGDPGLSFLKAALRNAKVAVAVQDKELRYTWAYNQEIITHAEVTGNFDHGIFTLEEAEYFTSAKKRVIAENIILNDQRWISRPNGRSFFQITWEPLIEDNGDIEGVISTMIDLTSTKEGEEALRESEERFRNLHENLNEECREAAKALTESEGRFNRIAKASHMGFVEWNVNKEISYWSPELYEMFGFEPGKPASFQVWMEGVHPDDQQMVMKNLYYLLENGRSKTMVSGEKFEFRFVKDSGIIWIESIMSVDLLNGDIIVSGVLRDATSRKITENALQESERRFRQLADAMPQLVWTANPDGTVDYYNKRHNEFSGFHQEEGGTWNWSPVVHPDDIACTMEAWSESIKSGNIYQVEHRVKMIDGNFHWYLSRAIPVKENGRIIKWYGTATDINDTKKAEQELLESAERYRILFETLDRAQSVGKIGNWRLDLKKNELIWSDENYRIFGVDIGKSQTYESFLSMIHPDDREYVDRKWQEGLKSRNYEIEHRILVNGEIKWVREKAFLEYDEKGELTAGFGITQDITERKQTENELTESRRKLDLALENANIGLWEWNTATNRLKWDERTDKMFGLPEGSFNGDFEDFVKLIDEEDAGHIRKAARDTLQFNKPFETIFRIRTNNQKQKYISSKALVNRNSNDQIVSLTGVNFDITDLKEGTELLISKLNEDLLRSNKELENFAFITSHDLQEPLRMVTSYTQLLALKYGDMLDDTAKEYINYSVEGAKRMYELINGLLAYSRISRKEITRTVVDTTKVIDIVKANLSLVLRERKCTIETSDLPVLLADQNQMIQLFQNLIANGIKFSKDPVRITVSARTEPAQFVFAVSDNGIGIEPQYFEKIFQVFKRLMPRDQYEGTGIGLAICKRIVENHGGRIWVESEPGKGSVFHFTITRKI